MSTNTTTRKTVAGAYTEIAAVRAEVSELRSDLNNRFDRIEALFAGNAKTAPAKTAPATVTPAPVEAQGEALKTLTRGAWKALRTTRNGATKKAFVGLTREQAHAKGLCPGYRLPTGEMRASLGA